jgi:hypothetical protein
MLNDMPLNGASQRLSVELLLLVTKKENLDSFLVAEK